MDTGILKTAVETFIMWWHLGFQWLCETRWLLWVKVCSCGLLWASHTVLSFNFLHMPTVIPNMVPFVLVHLLPFRYSCSGTAWKSKWYCRLSLKIEKLWVFSRICEHVTETAKNLEDSDVLFEELNLDCSDTWQTWWAVILDGNRMTTILVRQIHLGIAFVEKLIPRYRLEN